MSGGLLTGKYGPGQSPDEGRITENAMYQKRYGLDWVYEVAGDFTQFAREHGCEPAALTITWAAAHLAVIAPIIGARNLEQLEGSLKSLEVEMDADLRAEISAVSVEPFPATDLREEKA